jgi:hypothetical protein
MLFGTVVSFSVFLFYEVICVLMFSLVKCQIVLTMNITRHLNNRNNVIYILMCNAIQ